MKSLGLRALSLDIGLTFARQFLAGTIQLLIALLIARVLGSKGVGAYEVALLWPTILANLLNMGLVSSSIYFVASGRFPIAQVWAATRDFMIIVIGLGTGLASLGVHFFGNTIFPGIPQQIQFLAILIFPFSLAFSISCGFFQALQDWRSYNIAVLSQPISAISMLGLLWFLDVFTLSNALRVTVLSFVIALLVTLWKLRSHVTLLGASRDRFSYLRPAISYAWKVHAGNLVAFLNYRIDLYLVNFFVGSAGAGVYAIAIRLAEQLWIVSSAVSTVLFPKLTAMVDDDDGRKVLTPMIARAVFWLTLLLAGVLAVVSQPLIPIVFGAEFEGATIVLLILLPGIVLLSTSKVLANDLAARGNVGINLALAIGVLTLNTVGNFILLPHLGILGAATATSIAYGADFVTRLVFLKSTSNINWIAVLVPSKNDFSWIMKILSK